MRDLGQGRRTFDGRTRPLSSRHVGAALRHFASGVRQVSYRHCRLPYMNWADLEITAPRLATLAGQRLIEPGVLLVATIRRDGTPRLSPVEPLILDGELWLSMMWKSRKAADLQRDNRILLHSIITGRDGAEGEVKVRGQAIAVDDPATRARYCEGVAVLGWRPSEPYFHLFRVDLAEITVVRYAENGDQYVARWPDRVEFVRAATSATSVGAARPHEDLFAE